VVSRKVGSAVIRNRVKRLAREAYRETFSLWPKDAELVVVARRWDPNLRMQDVVAEWRSAEPRIINALSRSRKRVIVPQNGAAQS
jgi:ribonuclease P protein component